VAQDIAVPKRARTNKSGLAALAGAIVFAIAALCFASIRGEPRFIVVAGSGTISISTATLRVAQARFYVYQGGDGSSVKFIVARDETGHVQAAIDACEECAAYHEGYSSSSGYVVCRFCGNRYKLSALATGSASCVPWKLNYTMRGDEIQISSGELSKWRQAF
jgi:uncharacterized membrane protein